MNEESLIKVLQRRLCPEPYHEFRDGPEGISRLFVRKSFAGCRYVLAVAPWQPDVDAVAQLGTLRRSVDAAFDASWLRGVGLIVLWHGPQASWQAATQQLSPDIHGLRSTVVQGIILVDLDTGESHVRRSSWGLIKFGGLQGQFTRLKEALEELRTAQP